MTAFEVIAEPNRREILSYLQQGEMSVNDIVGKVGLSQPLVSKHMKTLRDAGLVAVRIDAQRRLYRLRQAGFVDLETWIEPFRRHWADQLRRLERHLENSDD